VVPGDSIDEEAPEAGEGLGAQPPRVVVVRLGAARVDHRDDAVLAAGVQEHPVHRVVAGAAAPEVEICRRVSAVRRCLGKGGGGGGERDFTVGVLEGEVVADEPAPRGAEDDDVAAGGHGGHDAVAPRGLALQGVHGEELAAASAGFHGRSHGGSVRLAE